MSTPVQLLIIEEHEPECGEFPVIVVGAAWTSDQADAVIAARIADQAPQNPGKTYQPIGVEADQLADEYDVWYETHAVTVPPDVPPVLYAQLRAVQP